MLLKWLWQAEKRDLAQAALAESERRTAAELAAKVCIVLSTNQWLKTTLHPPPSPMVDHCSSPVPISVAIRSKTASVWSQTRSALRQAATDELARASERERQAHDKAELAEKRALEAQAQADAMAAKDSARTEAEKVGRPVGVGWEGRNTVDGKRTAVSC